MNNQQRKTLEQVFANPPNGNLEWRKIEALLMAAGCERTMTFDIGAAKVAGMALIR